MRIPSRPDYLPSTTMEITELVIGDFELLMLIASPKWARRVCTSRLREKQTGDTSMRYEIGREEEEEKKDEKGVKKKTDEIQW